MGTLALRVRSPVHRLRPSGIVLFRNLDAILSAAEVECVPLPAAMPGLPIGHAVWRSKPDFRTAATAWLAAGASHHTAMSNQIDTRTVQDFATMTGVELLVIDDATTIESAERELRLNNATFR